MVLQQDKVESRSTRVIDALQRRLGVKSRSELARYLGLSPSTLLRQEGNGELPYKQMIDLAEKNNWSMDEILHLKNAEITNQQLDLPVELIKKYVVMVVRISEKYLNSDEISKRNLGEKKLASLRIDLAKILIELAITTKGNEAAVDLACRSILTINSA